MYNSVIELINIINFVKDFKRPFTEGSEIMKFNHIVKFHCTELTKTSTKIVALSATCTYKAGSGKCKHIVGG